MQARMGTNARFPGFTIWSNSSYNWCMQKSRLIVIAVSTVALVTGLFLSPRSGGVQYACAMSRTVSFSCCCGHDSAGANVTIQQACCCRVSVAERTDLPARSAASSAAVDFSPVPAVSAIVPIIHDAPIPAKTFFSARSSPTPLYVLNSTLIL